MDARRRELERRTGAGDLEAAAALLIARVRAGELGPERLALAARLGEPAAALATGERPEEVPGELSAWFATLLPWGVHVLVRATAAAAAFVLPGFERLAPGDLRPRGAVDAAQAWCDAPGAATVSAASRAARGALAAAQELARQADFQGEWARDDPPLYAGYHAACAAHDAAQAALLAARAPDGGETLVHQAGKVEQVLARAGADVPAVYAAARVRLRAWALDSPPSRA